MKSPRKSLWVVLAFLALLAVGCSRMGSSGRSDLQVATDVQNKINSDGSVPDKQITINANNGTVTLTGNVSNDAARNAAANDAAQVEGVKTVVNNQQVAPTTAADQMSQPQEQAYNPPAVREERRPSPPTRQRSSRPSPSSNSGDNGLRTTVPATPSSGSYDSSSTPTAPVT